MNRKNNKVYKKDNLKIQMYLWMEVQVNQSNKKSIV